MEKRKRDIQKKFRVNEEENKIIKEKMNKLGTNDFGAYARKMLIDGYIIKTDHIEIRNLIREINKSGVNINQIAKRANETNRVYEDDIKELKGELEEVWQLLKSNLSSQH